MAYIARLLRRLLADSGVARQVGIIAVSVLVMLWGAIDI